MITITDEQLDEMAGRLWLSEVEDHKCDPENVHPLAVYRRALETWFDSLISGMMTDVVSLAFGPYSRGAFKADLRLAMQKQEAQDILDAYETPEAVQA